MSSSIFFRDYVKGGEISQLLRDKDWSTTPLGPRESWPRGLSSYVSMILELPAPAVVYWGPEHVQIYNDSYAALLGGCHPDHLGAPLHACRPPEYERISPWIRQILAAGGTVEVRRAAVPTTRSEEAYFTLSFSPLRDDAGEITGALQLAHETTEAVLGDRRARALHELSTQTARGLREHTADIPWSVVYDLDAHDPSRLVRSSEVEPGGPSFPPELSLESAEYRALAEAIRDRRVVAVVASSEAKEPAVACPIVSCDQQSVLGLLVAGVSSRLRFDGSYRNFIELVAAHLAKTLSSGRTQELEDSNKELEAFSYSVAHDLRAPLRAIRSFGDSLRSEYAAQLDPHAAHYVDRICAAALRMSNLVEGLLDLSRVTRGTLVRRKVDVTALANTILDDLRAREPARMVTTNVASLLATSADARLVSIVLENLIGNAWKFSAKQRFAGIEIGSEARETETVFFVRDNGAGFEMSEATKLFAPFQRLHGADFEGTGIGLATVQRIVERHGGRIWAEGERGRGATFFFTLGCG